MFWIKNYINDSLKSHAEDKANTTVTKWRGRCSLSTEGKGQKSPIKNHQLDAGDSCPASWTMSGDKISIWCCWEFLLYCLFCCQSKHRVFRSTMLLVASSGILLRYLRKDSEGRFLLHLSLGLVSSASCKYLFARDVTCWVWHLIFILLCPAERRLQRSVSSCMLCLPLREVLLL